MNYLIILDDGHGIAPITPGKRTPIFNTELSVPDKPIVLFTVNVLLVVPQQ